MAKKDADQEQVKDEVKVEGAEPEVKEEVVEEEFSTDDVKPPRQDRTVKGGRYINERGRITDAHGNDLGPAPKRR